MHVSFHCRLPSAQRLQPVDMCGPPGAISDATQARHSISGHDFRGSVWDFRFLSDPRRNRRRI